MIGTFSSNRGLAIGIPLLFNFGIITMLQGVREVFYYVPHGIFFPITTENSIFTSLMLQLPIETILPIVITAGFSILFIIISVIKFNNEEF